MVQLLRLALLCQRVHTLLRLHYSLLLFEISTRKARYVMMMKMACFPPCNTFSKMRLSNVGRYGVTMETIQQDISLIGLPILRRTEEIIDYFKPSLYFIENPQTGRMKDYFDRPYYDVDYCKYSDWGMRKNSQSTRSATTVSTCWSSERLEK